jgi:putative membrane protein
MYKVSRLQFLILVLLGIYLFIYPWSILLISLDWVPGWGTWMGGALLIIQGSIMGLWLTANYGRYGLLASLLILLLSWFVEHVGTMTGFPFGSYRYTDVLIPRIMGYVPLAIPFAWLLVVPTAVGTTERLINKDLYCTGSISHLYRQDQKSGIWARAFGAASFALLLDLTIEPVAVHINGYWVWDYVGSGYYGVPASNFAAWWVTSLVLVWLLLVLQRAPFATKGILYQRPVAGSRFHLQPPRFRHILPWLPPMLYMLNLTMFVLVNIAHSHRAAAIIGGLILCYLAFDWLKPYINRRLVSSQNSNRQRRQT